MHIVAFLAGMTKHGFYKFFAVVFLALTLVCITFGYRNWIDLVDEASALGQEPDDTAIPV